MVTMCKALYAGTRAVASVMMMLIVFTYAFALVLHSCLKYEPSMKPYFGKIPRSMWTLTLQGIFLDGITDLFVKLRAIPAPVALGTLLCYVFLSTFVVINML